MKTKKQFWSQSNGSIGNSVNPIKQLHLDGRVEFFLKESRKCNCDGSFHRAIYPILVLAQCFGVLPVHNISAKCPLKLRFSWKSCRFWFAVFATMSCGLNVAFTVVWTFWEQVEFAKIAYLIFNSVNFLLLVCFLRLAKVWPQTMAKWHEVEMKLQPISTEKENRAMSQRIRRIAVVFFIWLCVDLLIYYTLRVSAVADCPIIPNVLEAYFVLSFPEIFTFFGYSHLLGFYVKLLDLIATFVWSFADLFIIVVACGISAKFKQINERLMSDKGKVRSLRC